MIKLLTFWSFFYNKNCTTMTETLENTSLPERLIIFIWSSRLWWGLNFTRLRCAGCVLVLLEGDERRALQRFVVPGLSCPAGSRGLHHGPESQSGDGGVRFEAEGELLVLAPLHQETVGEVGTTEPHPAIGLNLNTIIRSQKRKIFS